MSVGYSPRQNSILAALPAAELARLLPDLELVPMPLGHVLCDSGGKLSHVYFPITSIISMLSILMDGTSAEIAVVGNEGIVGVALYMGGETTTSRAVVHNEGYAYRLRGQLLKQAFRNSPPLRRLLLLYAQSLITQTTQTAACNRHHSVDQRLCRLLLLRLDRLPSNEMTVTHRLIADILGVRREGVTEAAGTLQSSGLIHYCHGHITVLDRRGVEARACECYQAVKRESERLIPAPAEAVNQSAYHHRQALPPRIGTLPHQRTTKDVKQKSPGGSGIPHGNSHVTV
jgi:CRP-like cAMP-binding protein